MKKNLKLAFPVESEQALTPWLNGQQDTPAGSRVRIPFKERKNNHLRGHSQPISLFRKDRQAQWNKPDSATLPTQGESAQPGKQVKKHIKSHKLLTKTMNITFGTHRGHHLSVTERCLEQQNSRLKSQLFRATTRPGTLRIHSSRSEGISDQSRHTEKGKQIRQMLVSNYGNFMPSSVGRIRTCKTILQDKIPDLVALLRTNVSRQPVKLKKKTERGHLKEYLSGRKCRPLKIG